MTMRDYYGAVRGGDLFQSRYREWRTWVMLNTCGGVKDNTVPYLGTSEYKLNLSPRGPYK